jgi:hypothetical protein
MITNNILGKAVLSAIAGLLAVPGAFAYNHDRTQLQQSNSGAYQPSYQASYQPSYRPPAYQQSISFHDYISTHPKLKSATVGAGVGTAAGAITGLITGRGVIRGAVIGAGAGAGTGLIRSSQTMQRHPIMRTIATGTMVGLGLGMAGSRMHGTTARTAGVGAAAGLGTALLVHGL